MLLYSAKVRLLKRPRFDRLWRRRRARRGEAIGNYDHLPGLVRRFAPGRRFVDVGCMWGVNGEYAFVAEEAGATAVTGVDVFGPTPEFEAARRQRGSSVRFVLGDVGAPETIEQIGVADVVLCAGVLYHHPSPYDLLVALRRICADVLILRTSTIPEVDGLPNAAVYFPLLPERDRRLWDVPGQNRIGITGAFEPGAGYANWFWGMTPSCVRSLAETAGFRVEEQETEPFAETLVCRAVEVPFAHRLPTEREARTLAADISAAGIARPA